MEQINRTTIIVGIIALVVIIGGLVYINNVPTPPSKTPQGSDYSKTYEIQSREHIAVGATHPAYNSNPPSGGWHYAQIAKRQFYDEQIPDGNVIHNMEHGDVWIAYHPRVKPEIKQALKKFLSSKIVISPRAENDFDISLVAWGSVDSFNIENDQLPEQRINDFIIRYLNKGPEDVPIGMDTNTFN